MKKIAATLLATAAALLALSGTASAGQGVQPGWCSDRTDGAAPCTLTEDGADWPSGGVSPTGIDFPVAVGTSDGWCSDWPSGTPCA